MKDWNSLYQDKGIIQREPSPRVLRAIDFFKERGLTRILDLGCGTGRHTACLVAAGFEAYGCDGSDEAIRIASGLVTDAAFARCDMTSLPYHDDCFDGIVCNHVLQHGKVSEIQGAISEIHRVLRRGGHLFVIAISTEHPKRITGQEVEPNTRLGTDAVDGHVTHHFFTEDELRSLFHDFEIRKLEHFKGPSELDQSKMSAAWELCAMKGR